MGNLQSVTVASASNGTTRADIETRISTFDSLLNTQSMLICNEALAWARTANSAIDDVYVYADGHVLIARANRGVCSTVPVRR